MVLPRIVIFIVLMVLTYAFVTSPMPNVTYSTSISNTSDSIPSAEVVHSSESMKVPPSVETFAILNANEANENWSDEKHKLITAKNSYYMPTNLIVPNGTGLVFLHADAP